MRTWNAKFVTYENRRNPHVAIHKNGCNQIEKNGGAGEGKYTGFSSFGDAYQYANTTGLPVLSCSFCIGSNA